MDRRERGSFGGCGGERLALKEERALPLTALRPIGLGGVVSVHDIGVFLHHLLYSINTRHGL